jgi:hypothetical protein
MRFFVCAFECPGQPRFIGTQPTAQYDDALMDDERASSSRPFGHCASFSFLAGHRPLIRLPPSAALNEASFLGSTTDNEMTFSCARPFC